jgi:hypothetical protein
MIKGNAPGRRGGRPPRSGGKAPGGSRPSTRSTPYARSGPPRLGSSGDSHMSMASVSDVAASDDPLLKVKADSTPNKVAGAICNVVRECEAVKGGCD